MPDTNVLAQSLDPAVRRGEDATVPLTGTFAASPVGWTTEFRLWRRPGRLRW